VARICTSPDRPRGFMPRFHPPCGANTRAKFTSFELCEAARGPITNWLIAASRETDPEAESFGADDAVRAHG
jgi:hypothetical protein